ncbi:MAG: hypothetical protein HY646_08520, partial [Acidobacteria bacterium]|nr:hypothetical protein [Acidobacteriota bacterium]
LHKDRVLVQIDRRVIALMGRVVIDDLHARAPRSRKERLVGNIDRDLIAGGPAEHGIGRKNLEQANRRLMYWVTSLRGFGEEGVRSQNNWIEISPPDS